jgi:multiple sugar transport system ATP-binding protein
VEYAEILGSDSFLYVATPQGTLTVRENGTSSFKNGSTVHLTPIPDHTHRFGEDGKRLN